MVEFDRDRCKGCGLCVFACPKKIISLDSQQLNNKGFTPATVREMDKCISCGFCSVMCPDCVITVIKES